MQVDLLRTEEREHVTEPATREGSPAEGPPADSTDSVDSTGGEASGSPRGEAAADADREQPAPGEPAGDPAAHAGPAGGAREAAGEAEQPADPEEGGAGPEPAGPGTARGEASEEASGDPGDEPGAEGAAPDGTDADAAAGNETEGVSEGGSEGTRADGDPPGDGPGDGGDPGDVEDADEHAPERDADELASELFAVLFASPDPLSTQRLATLLSLKGKKRVTDALADLQERLEARGIPLVLKSVAGGWRLFTRPDMGELVGRLAERKVEKVSPAALETLSIVAYRQPVTKGEIEAIRGVGSGPVLRSLVDRRLVRVSGRADQPGAPLLYGTTREFLETFGLDSLDDLPRDGELSRD